MFTAFNIAKMNPLPGRVKTISAIEEYNVRSRRIEKINCLYMRFTSRYLFKYQGQQTWQVLLVDISNTDRLR